MVVIRLARGGSKKSPFYHVVATDKRNSRDGRFIERLGYFNPVARGQATRLELNQERIDYWLAKGAQPSERVASILKKLKKGDAAITEVKPTRSEQRRAQAENAATLQAKKLAEEKQKAEAEAKAAAEAPSAEEAEKPAEDGQS